MNQIKNTWMTDGSAWIAEGMRHAQLVGTLNVPNVCPSRTEHSDNVHSKGAEGRERRTVHAALD